MKSKEFRGIKSTTLLYFIQETAKSLFRNGVMTVASMITVAVSTLILGSFLLLFFNSNHIASYLENSVQISVYMENRTSEEDINTTGAELAALPGVSEVKTVTKEEAMRRFKQRLGENASILDALEDNPLPYSFEVHVDTPERIGQITPIIQKMKKVESVRYARDVVEQLFQFTRIIRTGGVLLIALMMGGTLFIIINTIRLTVMNRRKEINIMKYVGATDWFIRWPFMMEGITIGLAGTVFSTIVLTFIYGASVDKFQQAMPFIPVLSTWPLMLWMWMGLLAFGAGIGALGSYISLKKYLQV
ncbi:MAG: permease-like cell division protein FtsX [Acidaminococcaceae bacterium]|nr:permease-like cell division protein FtsX [Acidaminococcaceae bacterium]